jgi:hypothetical protein
MSRKVQIVVLCEDDQQENFARAYLKSRGRKPCRVIKNPDGKGSAADFVIKNYPVESRERRREPVSRSLVVMLDEDTLGVTRRERQLADSCGEHGVPDRNEQDRAGIFIPARNIETWLRYLEGRQVNETDDYSPRGPHKPISCKQHIARLQDICPTGKLPDDAPQQLRAACPEVGRVL